MKKSAKILIFILLAVAPMFAKPYKGAELRTVDAFLYGRFETRCKSPQGEGFLASFFTYHPITIETAWNEIDIEILGRYSDNVQFTTITPGQKIYASHHHVAFINPHSDFHTYGFEWTPDYVAWFVDGEERYRQTGEHIATLNLPQKIMMNIWIPEYENWVGVWDDRQLPRFAWYDWVSYASYAPGAGDTGTDDNFAFQWKDDFDSLDAGKWDTASHTWSGNLVDLDPQNVVFKDGCLILCLTDDVNKGFVDVNPPYIQWARGEDATVDLYFTEKVDTVSGNSLNTFYIPGLEIHAVELHDDQRTAHLRVSPMDSFKNYSVAVLGLKDASPNANKQIGHVAPILVNQPLSFPVKINIGGSAYGDYATDQLWGPAVEYGRMDGRKKEWPASIDIMGTEDDSLYRFELTGAVKYNIRVPEGVYDLTLYFAENEFTQPGRRVFDIVIEDSLVASGVDLAAVVGMHRAYTISAANISVQDGVIDIHLINRIGDSLLNGIVIEKQSTLINYRDAPALNHFKLQQNYPNPFNPITTIRYSIAKDADVQLSVYDISGRRVALLVSQWQDAGDYSIAFDGSELSSSVYVYQLKTSDGLSISRKMLLIK